MVRTNLILSMVIVGVAFLAIMWVGLAIYALDGMDGKQDSPVTYYMLTALLLFGFVEHSMWSALPAKI